MVDDTGFRLADREAIRDVLHRYCRGIDRRDIDLLKSCYHVDSLDQRSSFAGSGHSFCDYAMQQVADALFTQHRSSNELMEFEKERAFVESYVHAIHRVDAGDRLLDYLHYGRYCDIFERRDAIWRIAHRLHLPDGDTIVEIVEPTGRSSRPGADQGGRYYARGARDRSDASYLRFETPSLYREVPPVAATMHGHKT